MAMRDNSGLRHFCIGFTLQALKFQTHKVITKSFLKSPCKKYVVFKGEITSRHDERTRRTRKRGWLPLGGLKRLRSRTFCLLTHRLARHLQSLRYFWWTGSLESGHGEHEIGFYHNHGLRSFVVATAENPHPASCAVLALDPLHKFFFRGLGNSGEEVLQSCNNHVERWKARIHMQNHNRGCQAPISAAPSLTEFTPRCEADWSGLYEEL